MFNYIKNPKQKKFRVFLFFHPKINDYEMREKHLKNGKEKEQKILQYLQEQIHAPASIDLILKKAQKRKEFKTLTRSTLRNRLNALFERGEIVQTTCRELHPKRKPILLFHFDSKKAT